LCITWAFKNLFLVEIQVVNRGNQDLERFEFGATLSEGDRCIYVEAEIVRCNSRGEEGSRYHQAGLSESDSVRGYADDGRVTGCVCWRDDNLRPLEVASSEPQGSLGRGPLRRASSRTDRCRPRRLRAASRATVEPHCGSLETETEEAAVLSRVRQAQREHIVLDREASWPRLGQRVRIHRHHVLKAVLLCQGRADS